MLLANINQPFPQVAPLHHIPTVLLLLAAPFLLKRWPLTDGALACIVMFFLLHTLGGRYTYTSTPYNDWTEALFGFELNSVMEWERNHYDRLVHFCFGLFSVYPAQQLLRRYAGVSRALGIYVAIEFVMGISAIYEIIEWLLSLILAGDDLESYNGQQGDIWDAQKDMALAFLGSLTASFVFIIMSRRYSESI
ncbi:MAG: DUF2238 domain-containing protein [Pseudomonadota bacterium]